MFSLHPPWTSLLCGKALARVFGQPAGKST
jgi:hypothetical protein